MQKVFCSDSPKEMHQPTFVEISVEAFSGILYCGRNVLFRHPLWLFLSVMTCKMFFAEVCAFTPSDFSVFAISVWLTRHALVWYLQLALKTEQQKCNNDQPSTTLLRGFRLFTFAARDWRPPLPSLKSCQAANLWKDLYYYQSPYVANLWKGHFHYQSPYMWQTLNITFCDQIPTPFNI